MNNNHYDPNQPRDKNGEWAKTINAENEMKVMTFTDYMNSVKNETSLPLNFHTKVRQLSTFQKWVDTFRNNFKDLKGSEKQIKWANTIRNEQVEDVVGKFINQCASTNLKFNSGISINDKNFKVGYGEIEKWSKNENASYFIDLRDESVTPNFDKYIFSMQYHDKYKN